MRQNKPEWLRVRAHGDPGITEVSLHTVCQEASCPNQLECFGRQTVTFLILGRCCTRNCTFCNVDKGLPEAVDPLEPSRVAQAVEKLRMRHVVLTSVSRDDLPDGGAGHYVATIGEIRRLNSSVSIEVLVPDFAGDLPSLARVVEAMPDIINHNVETVPRLYPSVRPLAVYERSLELLGRVKMMNPECVTKSGLMLGLGEREEEVLEVLGDLREVGCDCTTIGQYLAPSERHHPVVQYIHPDSFESYRRVCDEMGFRRSSVGPFVRSSYRADEVLKALAHTD
jgi:lipoic acid synthetase